MPRFITVGYGDEQGYRATDADVRNAAHAADARLLEQGAIMGIAGDPIQVRNHGGRGLEISDGPYRPSSLPVAGFAVIEAANLEDAVQMIAHSPCAVADGVVEVWPLREG